MCHAVVLATKNHAPDPLVAPHVLTHVANGAIMQKLRLITKAFLLCSATLLTLDVASAQQAGAGTIVLSTLGYTLGNGSGYYTYTDPTPVPLGSTQYANLQVMNMTNGVPMALSCYVYGAGVTIFQGSVQSNFSATIQWTPTIPGTYEIYCQGTLTTPGGHYPGSGYQPPSGQVQIQTTTLNVTIK